MMGDWLVACLCAEWCGSCRDYRHIFERQGKILCGPARFGWIDIEDHPEVLGSLELETFPALLIARGDEILFFGPVTPREATLAKLVHRALDGALARVADPALAGLPTRARCVLGGEN